MARCATAPYHEAGRTIRAHRARHSTAIHPDPDLEVGVNLRCRAGSVPDATRGIAQPKYHAKK